MAASGKGCDKSERWGVGDRGRRGRRWKTKEKKKTKRRWVVGMGVMKGKRKKALAPKEKSEKVWSNSRACCYLNPSRTAWVVRGWRGILSSSRCDENIRRITFDNDPCDGIFTLHVWWKQLLRDDGFALPTAWSSRARWPKLCVWRWQFLKYLLVSWCDSLVRKTQRQCLNISYLMITTFENDTYVVLSISVILKDSKTVP